MGEASPENGELLGTDVERRHLGLSRQGGSPKSTARLLWAFFSLFVVYGTAFPFRFHWDSFSLGVARINWRPLGGVAGNLSLSDILQNILLFIPFGFLGYFSLIHKRSRMKKTAVVALGTLLSLSVEFLQIFSATRWPAMSDIVFNTLGAALGLAMGVALKRAVLGFKSNPEARRFLDAPAAFPALVFLILTVAGCWEPFDFALDFSAFKNDIKRLLFNPPVFTRPNDGMVAFIRFLLTTLFVCRVAQESGLRRPALKGVLLLMAAGVALEASQIIIQSRQPDYQDAIVSMLGAAAGGVAFFFPGFHKRPWTWAAAGIAAVYVSVAMRSLYPFRFTETFSGFNWVPFHSQYERTDFAALGNFLESGTVFFPVGFLLGYFFPRLRPGMAAAALAGIMAMSIEAAQGYVAGRYPDVTDVIAAMLGAAAGGLALTRGWPAFRNYMKEEPDNEV